MSVTGAIAGSTSITENAPAAAALLSQLQRLQQQLSEALNGVGKSPADKASVDAIRARITQIEQRIAQSDQVSERREAGLRAGKTEPAASLAAEAGTVSQPRKSAGAGQIIDTFA